MTEDSREDFNCTPNRHRPGLTVCHKNSSSKIPIRLLGRIRFNNTVWNSSCLMEQRAVGRFFTLKKLSVKDIRAELEGVYGYEALTLPRMKKSRDHFPNERINLEDDSASARPPQSDLRESLRAVIKESRFLWKRTCERLRIAKTTCLRVPPEHIGFRKCYLRWVPHSLNEN
jgi:hypothetical protein